MQTNYNINKASVFIKTTSYIENKNKITFSKNELEILDAKFAKYAKYILDHTNGQTNDFTIKAYNERVAIYNELCGLEQLNQAELKRLEQITEISKLNQTPKEDPALQQARSHRSFLEFNFSPFESTTQKREAYHQLLSKIVEIYPDRKIYLLRPSSNCGLALDTINNPNFGESELRKINSTLLYFHNGVFALGNTSQQRYSSIDEVIQTFFGGDPNFISFNELKNL